MIFYRRTQHKQAFCVVGSIKKGGAVDKLSFASLKKSINGAVEFETPETLKKAGSAFRKEIDRHKRCAAAVGAGTYFSESFNALMKAYFEPLNIPEHKYGAEVFEITGISDKVYRTMRSGGAGYRPSYKTVVALCAGLDLDVSLAESLLQKCGRSFSNSDEHIAFRLILTAYRGYGITKRNDCLEALGHGRLTDDK